MAQNSTTIPRLEQEVILDGRRITLGLNSEWNLSSHFEVSNKYEYNKVRFGNRGQQFEAHIARLRFRAALNRKVSLTTYAQYSSRTDKTSISALSLPLCRGQRPMAGL